MEETLVCGTCNKEHGCNLRTFPNRPALSLQRLAEQGLETVEDAVTPVWWTNLEAMVQHLAPAGTVGGCAVLVYTVARLIHLGGQRLCPGGLPRRCPRPAAQVDEEVEVPLNPLPAPVIQAPIVAVAQPFVPNVL